MCYNSKYIRNKPLNAKHLRLGSPWFSVAGRAHPDNVIGIIPRKARVNITSLTISGIPH
jgi:hypothetical protein